MSESKSIGIKSVRAAATSLWNCWLGRLLGGCCGWVGFRRGDMRGNRNAGGCIGVGVGGDVADVRPVGFLRVIAGFEIAAWGVVRLHAAGGDPR